MCIVFLHHHPSSGSVSLCPEAGGGQCACPYLLVLAVNRDEFFERATKPLGFWGKGDIILGGQDLQREEASERGTWLGVSRNGRLAVLTNYRTHASEIRPDAKTRGCIVSDFLVEWTTPQEYCRRLLQDSRAYNGFSTIVADLTGESEVAYCSNCDTECADVRVLPAGNYGLSNQLLDSPWYKVQRGRKGLQQALGEHCGEAELTEELMKMLADDTCLHPDPNIPDTGFSAEQLKYTSSIFVQPMTLHGHKYGTRTSSVVLVDRSGKVTFTERTLTFPDSLDNPVWNNSQFTFNI